MKPRIDQETKLKAVEYAKTVDGEKCGGDDWLDFRSTLLSLGSFRTFEYLENHGLGLIQHLTEEDL